MNYRVYGVRKLWKAARRARIVIGRDQTARLMRVAGIEGARRSKRVKTTRPDPASARHPDLVKREFTATAPNRLWVTDLKRPGSDGDSRYLIPTSSSRSAWTA